MTEFEFEDILKGAMSADDVPSEELNEKLKKRLGEHEAVKKPAYYWVRNVAASVVIVLTAATAVLNSSSSIAVRVNNLPVVGALTKNLTFRDYYENVPAEIAKQDAVKSNDVQNKIIVPKSDTKEEPETLNVNDKNYTKVNGESVKKESEKVVKKSRKAVGESLENKELEQQHTEVVINNADSAIFEAPSVSEIEKGIKTEEAQPVNDNSVDVITKSISQNNVNNPSDVGLANGDENIPAQASEEVVDYSVQDDVKLFAMKKNSENPEIENANENTEDKVSGGGSSARGGGGGSSSVTVQNGAAVLTESLSEETAVEEQIPLKINDIYDFGVEMTLKKIKPTGAKLICSQSEGTVTGELTTGSEYTIEVMKNGEWEKLDYVNEISGWTLIGYKLDTNSSIEFDINWENVYGKLNKGEYRIGKKFMDFRSAGDYHEQIYYALFEIK